MASFVVKKASKGEKKPLKIILGKSVLKSAVKRNLLKRRIKAVARPIIHKSGETFVIIVKPGAAKLSYKEIEREITGGLDGKR